MRRAPAAAWSVCGAAVGFQNYDLEKKIGLLAVGRDTHETNVKNMDDKNVNRLTLYRYIPETTLYTSYLIRIIIIIIIKCFCLLVSRRLFSGAG